MVNFLLILAIIIMGITLVVVYRYILHLSNYSQELQALIMEAKTVKQDLEELMLQTIQVTEHSVEQIQLQIQKAGQLNSGNQNDISDGKEVKVPDNTVSADLNEPDDNIDIKLYLQEWTNKEKAINHGQDEQRLVESPESYSANVYGKVCELYDSGMTIREIARQMNRGQGEISLMLNLAGKKKVG